MENIIATIDMAKLIETIFTLVFIILTSFIIPYIKSKLTAQQWKNLQEIASVAVTAAEAIFKGTSLGKQKLEYVTNYIDSICIKNGYKFDSDDVKVAIENAWKNMNDKMLTETVNKAEISE